MLKGLIINIYREEVITDVSAKRDPKIFRIGRLYLRLLRVWMRSVISQVFFC